MDRANEHDKTTEADRAARAADARARLAADQRGPNTNTYTKTSPTNAKASLAEVDKQETPPTSTAGVSGPVSDGTGSSTATEVSKKGSGGEVATANPPAAQTTTTRKTPSDQAVTRGSSEDLQHSSTAIQADAHSDPETTIPASRIAEEKSGENLTASASAPGKGSGAVPSTEQLSAPQRTASSSKTSDERESVATTPAVADSTPRPGPHDQPPKWEKLDHLGRLTRSEFPYLERCGTQREAEAVNGKTPTISGTLDSNPDRRAVPRPNELRNFSGRVKPATLQAGKPYYRVVGQGSEAAGSWWTDTPPADNAAVRRDLAIKNEWNGDHGLERFVPNRDINMGWEGRVGAQPATKGPGYLPGGGHQIWIPRRSLELQDGDWSIAALDPGGSINADSEKDRRQGR